MTDHFESPKLLLTRARENVDDLKSRIKEFFDRKPYASVIDFDSETGQDVHKIRLTAKLPGSLGTILKDAVANLRDALDHAVYGSAVALGRVEPKGTKFPFADSGAEFEGEIMALKDVPPVIRTLLESFRPYPRGNEPLWALNKMRNQKTHRIIVPLGVCTPGNEIGVGTFKIVPPAQFGYSRWDATKNEVEYMRVGRGSQCKYQVTVAFDVAIGDVPVLAGRPVIATLNELTTEVERIALAIEAETARVLRE